MVKNQQMEGANEDKDDTLSMLNVVEGDEKQICMLIIQ